MNLATILVLVVIAVAIAAAIKKIRRSECSSGCICCPHSENCGRKIKKKQTSE